MMLLSQACTAVGGTWYSAQGRVVSQSAKSDSQQLSDSSENPLLEGVGTDTRHSLSQQLFVALKGPTNDGHDHLAEAVAQGARAVMTERYCAAECPQIVVPNTYQALTDLAYWWRRQHAPVLLGVTGSAGKTSVKEMLASILSQCGATLSTLGNLNNEIGVPLTLLRLRAEHRFAVIEMGMNHAGEIARLTKLAAPFVALINNAGEAHLENLGSLSAIAAAKGEIYSGLDTKGIAIVNADDQFAEFWRERAHGRSVITFGMEAAADVRASYTQQDRTQTIKLTLPSETVTCELHGRGRHNVMNALAAAAAAHAVGVSASHIAAGLATYRSVGQRLTEYHIGGTTIFDDTYNANPASTKAAMSVLADFATSIAILGDMAELGAEAAQLHREVGDFAACQNISALWACGAYSQAYVDGFRAHSDAPAYQFADQASLIEFLQTQVEQISAASAILIKGSRSAHMEVVTAMLREQLELSTQQSNHSQGDVAC